MEEYTFNNIIDIIEITKKYKLNRRKRPRNETDVPYNWDMERLIECLPALKKLNNLIGMESVKKNIIDQVLFYTQKLNTNEMNHCCIYGNPGTGKTTLGKILAELYCSLGFLKTDNFRVVGRSDLIAGYVGQTALKTMKVLTESLDGVLFIDEAYSIGGSEDERGSTYSKECLDTINKFLSENTTNFIMVIAGYKEEMEKYFFSMNKGLKRRFPWVYDITDYSAQNLKDIFVYQVRENYWFLHKDLNDEVLTCFFKEHFELFNDNGGSTLVLFDKAKIIHSRRVFGKILKKVLSIQDLREASKLMEKKPKLIKEPPFGMYI